MRKKILIILSIITTLVIVTIFSFKSYYNYTFPFSNADHIEVISYPNRMDWDTIPLNGESFYFKEIIENGNLLIDSKRITSRIELDKTHRIQLFNILFNSPCLFSERAACFEPRDAVIFYNDEKVIGAIEICLACSTIRTSQGIESIDLCSGKVDKIEVFLKEIKSSKSNKTSANSGFALLLH